MNNKGTVLILPHLIFMMAFCTDLTADTDVVWNIDNLQSIGGHKVEVAGTPKVIKTDKGKAVEFDGIKDGLMINTLPVAGADKFTIEVIFRPEANDSDAQKFLHMQENGANNRILIVLETPMDKNHWYLDTYVRSTKGKANLYKPANVHPMSRWYNATLVCDGQSIRHYVNGVEEASGNLPFSPLNQGRTAIGAKLSKESWFKGAISKIRFSRRVLKAEEFLKP